MTLDERLVQAFRAPLPHLARALTERTESRLAFPDGLEQVQGRQYVQQALLVPVAVEQVGEGVKRGDVAHVLVEGAHQLLRGVLRLVTRFEDRNEREASIASGRALAIGEGFEESSSLLAVPPVKQQVRREGAERCQRGVGFGGVAGASPAPATATVSSSSM